MQREEGKTSAKLDQERPKNTLYSGQFSLVQLDFPSCFFFFPFFGKSSVVLYAVAVKNVLSVGVCVCVCASKDSFPDKGGWSTTRTLIAALGGRVLVPQEELDFLFARPPLLQVVVHHVLEGNRSLCGGGEETLISYRRVAGEGGASAAESSSPGQGIKQKTTTTTTLIYELLSIRVQTAERIPGGNLAKMNETFGWDGREKQRAKKKKKMQRWKITKQNRKTLSDEVSRGFSGQTAAL